MTQKNAALVEESTAAAASMRDQAQRLAEVVSVFNGGATSARSAAPAPRPAAAPAPRFAPAPAKPAVAAPPQPAPAAKLAHSAKLGHSAQPAAPSPAPAAKGSDDDWESF